MENQPVLSITGVDELDTNAMFLMGLAYKQFRAKLALDMIEVSSVSLEMFGAMKVLSQYGSITQQQLANYLLRNRSVTKRLVDNAIKLGLIVASKSATNKKVKLLMLTAEGKQLVDECMPLVIDVSKQFQNNLSTAESKQLQHLLAKLVQTDQLTD